MTDRYPLGCHRPRIPDRLVFDKFVQVLVLGAAYDKIADSDCSDTKIRCRRDEWLAAGAFEKLEQLCLEAYDCRARPGGPGGGRVHHQSSVQWRGRQALSGGPGKPPTKRSVLVEGTGIPLGTVVAPANRHDSPMLRPTLETLSRLRFDQPERITVHLDANFDSKATRGLLADLGCDGKIAVKDVPAPIQNRSRRVVERTESWHNRGFKKLAICTEKRLRVIEAFIALANEILLTRRLIRQAWTRHRWDTRPDRRP